MAKKIARTRKQVVKKPTESVKLGPEKGTTLGLRNTEISAKSLLGESMGNLRVGNSDTGMEPGDLFIGSPRNPATAKKTAVKRARKVDTGLVIRRLIESFQTDVNAQLGELTQKVEGQITALVNTVATIATTKANFIMQAENFRDTLKGLLGLNDELEPMEVEEMFFGDDRYEGAPEDPKIRAVAAYTLDASDTELRGVAGGVSGGDEFEEVLQ